MIKTARTHGAEVVGGTCISYTNGAQQVLQMAKTARTRGAEVVGHLHHLHQTARSGR